MRIAFAGSATNPSHNGHTMVLSTILSCGLFDRVIWYPSGFSDKPGMIDSMHRLQMAQLAFPQKWLYRPHPGWATLLIDPSEVRGPEVPTVIRFQQLREAYPSAELTFVTGSDVVTPRSGVFPIFNWKQYSLLQKEEIMVIPRRGYALCREVELPKHIHWLTEKPLPNISSGQIRQMISEGNPRWEKLVNHRVRDYIKLNHLYRGGKE